jgi:hypothetical protein
MMRELLFSKLDVLEETCDPENNGDVKSLGEIAVFEISCADTNALEQYYRASTGKSKILIYRTFSQCQRSISRAEISPSLSGRRSRFRRRFHRY